MSSQPGDDFLEQGGGDDLRVSVSARWIHIRSPARQNDGRGVDQRRTRRRLGSVDIERRLLPSRCRDACVVLAACARNLRPSSLVYLRRISAQNEGMQGELRDIKAVQRGRHARSVGGEASGVGVLREPKRHVAADEPEAMGCGMFNLSSPAWLRGALPAASGGPARAGRVVRVTQVTRQRSLGG